ncbi:unnamed protein product [Closterium sp. Yama58-4]|nr:unnamed protein product [Closterium sp. Yama58-4]
MASPQHGDDGRVDPTLVDFDDYGDADAQGAGDAGGGGNDNDHGGGNDNDDDAYYDARLFEDEEPDDRGGRRLVKKGGGGGREDEEERWEEDDGGEGVGGADPWDRRDRGKGGKRKKGKEGRKSGGRLTKGPANSEEDVEGARTGEDDAFIDDAGVHPDDRHAMGYDEYDDQRISNAPQAEEEDEVGRLFKGGKRRRNEMSDGEKALFVEEFHAKMLKAAEDDAHANRQHRPAINKLRMLPEMLNTLRKKHLQREFLDRGVFSYLKNWLEPLPDLSLPNIKIRTSILELVKESRPIFDKSTHYRDLRDDYDRPTRPPPSQREDAAANVSSHSRPDDLDLDNAGEARGEEEEGAGKKRMRTRVPQPMAMDFRVRPESKVTEEMLARRGQKDSRHQSVVKKLQKLRQGKTKNLRAEKVSVQGRGMVKFVPWRVAVKRLLYTPPHSSTLLHTPPYFSLMGAISLLRVLLLLCYSAFSLLSMECHQARAQDDSSLEMMGTETKAAKAKHGKTPARKGGSGSGGSGELIKAKGKTSALKQTLRSHADWVGDISQQGPVLGGCDVTRLDPAAFLSRYRNKVFAIAGDSFSGNFGNAIRCSLHSYARTREFRGRFGSTDVRGYRVEQYNVTVIAVSAVFLVDAEPIGAASSSGVWKVYLDTPRVNWGDILDYLDVFIFSAGHWFTNAPANLRQYYINGVQQTNISGVKAMEIAHVTVRDHIIRSNYRGIPVMLSYSPFHYEEAYGGKGSKHSCRGAKMPFTAAELATAETSSDAFAVVDVQVEDESTCDFGEGRWVISPNKALYSGKTCPFIRSNENCQKNGRRDTGYLNWRWQPRGCDVTRLDPAAFLSRYRNKVFAIAGDSFSSNFGNAIRCSLNSYAPTVDFSGEFGGTDVKGYRVAQYNFTFLHISSVYLVDAEPIGAAKSSGAWKVYLDTPRDKWGDILDYLDVFIFSAGHWFVNVSVPLSQHSPPGFEAP